MSERDYSLVDHLDELRKRILISLASVVALAIVSYCFSEWILTLVTAPIRGELEKVYFFSPYEAFAVRIEVALISGLILSLPVILTQLWLFLRPGLYPNERRVILPVVAWSLVLFLIGAAFAYLIVVPFAIKFFLSFKTESLQPMMSVGKYVSFLATFVLAFGVAFDFPVFVMGLVGAGLLSAKKLSAGRKYAIVIIFILGAILTPPDVLSQLLLAVPLVALYEICVIGAKIIGRKKAGVENDK